MTRRVTDPAQLRALTARAVQCRCGRPLYEHSRHVVPNAGIREYTCSQTKSGRFESATLPRVEYHPDKGLIQHG